MSHYSCIAIPAPGGSMDTLMARYDENREVAPHKVKCGCARSAHIENCWNALKEKFGVEYLDQKRKAATDDTTDEAWRAMIAPYIAERDRLMALPEPPPDEACEDCHGTGQRETTRNPDSKWDWWVIGGRWNGAFGGKNETTVGEILACGVVPFAIVTPDGWAERGEMGWFACVSNEKPPGEWEQAAKALLGRLDPAAKAFVIDCHI